MIDLWICLLVFGAWVVGFVSGFFAVCWLAACDIEKAVDNG